jgi:DNA-binding MurR/RpiR family transcriptional regulator
MSANPRLRDRIQESYDHLSPAHRRVVDYLVGEKTTAAFLTSDQLAGKIGISSSTVVRCAMELGYRGYAELRREMQTAVSESLRPVERLERPARAAPDVVRASLQRDIENMRELGDGLDGRAVTRTVELLEAATRVFARAARTSEPIGTFLAMSLSQMRSNVVPMPGIDSIPEVVNDIRSTDVLVAIALPRYTSSTIRVARYFKDRGVPVIAITDSFRSPLAGLADPLLTVPFQSASFFNSNVAAFALVNVLLAAFAAKRRDQLRHRLERGEAVWKYFNTHHSSAARGGAQR